MDSYNYNYSAVENELPRVRASGWVILLRVVAVISIVAGCLVSVICGLAIMVGAGTVGEATGVIPGLIVMVVGVAMSFISAASIMVFLDMAADIRAIRVMTERKR